MEPKQYSSGGEKKKHHLSGTEINIQIDFMHKLHCLL